MRLYTRAISYYRPDALKLSVFVALGVAAHFLGLLAPWPLAILIDTVLVAPSSRVAGGNEGIHRLLLSVLPSSVVGQVVGLAVMLLLIKAAQELLKLASMMTQFSLNFGVLMRVRRGLFHKFQSMTPLEHGKLPEGDAVVRLCYDANGPAGIVNSLIDAAFGLGLLVSIGYLLFSASPALALAAMSVLPVLILIDQWYGRATRRHSENAVAADTRMVSGLQRTMGAITLVQAFGRQNEEAERFDAEVGQSVRAWLGLHWQQLCYTLAVGLTFAVGTAVVLGYGGYMVHQGHAGLTVGALAVFISYMGSLFDPLCKVTGLSTALARNAIASKRVFDVLDRQPPVVEKPDATPLPLQPRVLEFAGVHAGYEPGKPVLGGVDMRIRPGEVVALVGPSGGGKSTVLSLMARFFDPTDGAVMLDGHDFRDLKLNDLRRHMAVVPQEPVLLPASIFENIAYGRPDASLDQVKEAARLAGAADFIDKLEHGYDAKVGREGASLSGGQKQRIAIARALLSDAPILVLDEPTSALDGETEKAFSRTIFNLRGLRSVIIVTHRAKPLTSVDRVYVLDGGRISETGSPRELLEAGGWFARHYADGLVGAMLAEDVDAEAASSRELALAEAALEAAGQVAPTTAALKAAANPVADAAVKAAAVAQGVREASMFLAAGQAQPADTAGIEWPPTPLAMPIDAALAARFADASLGGSSLVGTSLSDSAVAELTGGSSGLSGLADLSNLTDSAVGLPRIGGQLTADDLDDGGYDEADEVESSDDALIPVAAAD